MKAPNIKAVTVGTDPWEKMIAATLADPKNIGGSFLPADRSLDEIREMLNRSGFKSSIKFARKWTQERIASGEMIAVDIAAYDSKRRLTIRQRKFRVIAKKK